MPAQRNAILTAKVERIGEILADVQELRGTPRTERPDQASLGRVDAALIEAIRELAENDGSAGSTGNIELPSARLPEIEDPGILEPVSRAEISAGSREEFKDARASGDLQRQIDDLYLMITGDDPTASGGSA